MTTMKRMSSYEILLHSLSLMRISLADIESLRNVHFMFLPRIKQKR